MMSDVTDPHNLTKDQLLRALSDHGVDRLPQKKSKKQVLVDLYIKHIHNDFQENETASAADSFQFSSDEDESLISSSSEVQFNFKIRPPAQEKKSRASNRRRPNSIMPPSKRREPLTEVKEMSNTDLAEALKGHGVDVGPILVSTRRVYERKLTDIIHRGTGAGDEEFSASEEEYIDDDTYDEEENMIVDDEPEVVPPAPRGYEPSAIRQRPQIRQEYDSSERTTYSYSSSAYTAGDMGTRTTDTKPAVTPKPPPPKKGFSLLTKLIIFLVLALLVYLVVTNIETIRPKPAALTGDTDV